MKFKYTHMLTLVLLATLSLSANEQNEKQIILSAVEVQEIYDNPTRSYVYVGRDVSNLADIIAEISKLETDENSPIRALDAHINKGFVIGNYDGVAQALEHAEAILNATDPNRESELSQALNTIIEQVDAEQLNINAEVLAAANVAAPETRACGSCNSHCLRKLVIKEKADFLNKVTFHDDVRFKDDVTINDTLTVGNEIVSCDLTVGCNLNINNTATANIGNIVQGGVRLIHTFGINNIFVGRNAGNYTLTGTNNAAFGFNALTLDTTGSFNTAVGASALAANTAGVNNTAVGTGSLQSNTIGINNTAVGSAALQNNTTGINNTAVGITALASNITGTQNTAVGTGSLQANSIGINNTAVGYNALALNTTGGDNIAMGVNALLNNTTGVSNTAVGTGSLQASTIGTNNTAVGTSALAAVTTGSTNIAIGSGSGATLTTGSNNIYIGANAAAAAESNVTRIGGIRGATTGVANAIAVLIDSTGQLGTINSSKSVKHNIQSMNDVSANIYNLNPVTFVYNGDASETTQYGLVAEEVADVFPGIVVRNANGQPETVQYHVLPILTLNELQKLAARVAVLEAQLMN